MTSGSMRKLRRKWKNFLKQMIMEKKTQQNLWNPVKGLLRGKFMAINAYIKKEEKLQINNLTMHFKELEKREQTKRKISRKKEIIKIRS